MYLYIGTLARRLRVKNRSKINKAAAKFDTVNRTVKLQVVESTNMYIQKNEKAAKKAENAMQNIEKTYTTKVAKLNIFPFLFSSFVFMTFPTRFYFCGVHFNDQLCRRFASPTKKLTQYPSC